MFRVQISARIIRWPKYCACCCRGADTVIDASSTRTTGVKVIRSQTVSWEVPYCDRCLRHIDVSHRLRRFSLFVIHWTAVLVALGIATSAAVIFLVGAKSLILGLTLGVIVGAIFGVAVCGTFRSLHERYHRNKRAKQAARAELRRRLDSLMCDGCAEEDRLAAEYGGWYGSVHTFYFSNREFVSLFRSANQGKCLG